MGNIKNYTFDKLDFRLSNSDYWDFTLNTDAIKNTSNYSENIIASFDFSAREVLSLIPDFNVDDFSGDDFYTNYGVYSEYAWSGASSSNFSATTYGLTAYDNMAVTYVESDDNDSHTTLLSYLTGTTLIHTSGDTKLVINQVSGATGGHIYPVTLVIDSGTTGNYVSLCGGFYQGYYKLDGWDYQVLPTRYEKGFTVETWLRPSTGCTSGFTGTTLNETYPNNKGFFYYTGTRAENKFWTVFTGNTSSACTSGDTHMCMDVKETDIDINNILVDGILTSISVPLSPPPIDVALIENNFLIFGRSNGKQCDNTGSDDGYGQVRADRQFSRETKYYSTIVRQEQVDFQNQFLTFGRSNGRQCNNDTSDDGYGQVRADRQFSGFTKDVLELDVNADIIDNAIGFRIKDDGSIGYRLLTVSADCKTIEMVEEYSVSGMVTSDQWEHIVVKWINNDEYSECDLVYSDPRKGHLKFYVNSNLIFISEELDEFLPKRLFELQEKQIGVPYNISIGGGTQGLLESLTFDGQDPDDLGLVIEQNFAGSFIGDMSSFKLYDKNLSWCEIKDSYNDKLTIYR
jgi:hypothetical protein